jgi:26S proteasome regulatory subunit N3
MRTSHAVQPDAHKKKLESTTAREERLAAESELAKALEEENEEEDTMDGF